jgi:arylformamidase
VSLPLGRIYDISPTISERIGVFPGDTRYKRNIALDFGKGDHLLLSSIQTTLHLGAHADGPSHYSKTGEGIDQRDLNLYLGTCLVLEAKVARNERVKISNLNAKWQGLSKWPASRILVKTGSFPIPDQWNSDFCSLDSNLIEKWAESGVRLIGIDTPSIDPEQSKTLDAHHMVAKYNLAILEGLVLTDVPEGLYTLVALPLKLENADAAPVRAILIAP